MPEKNPVDDQTQRQDVPLSRSGGIPPIKLPDPPDEEQAEIPKVGCRDAPGG
jgi:hypothetical protein